MSKLYTPPAAHIKRTLPLNTDEDGNCHTLKASYFKTGRINFQRKDGFVATGVKVVCETD